MSDEQNIENKGGDEQAGADERKFTQADLDRIVQERLARAKPADYDELREKAQRLDEIEEQNATEHEKALKAARKEAADEVRAELNRERVMDKIEIAAKGLFRDLEDARLRLGPRAEEFVTDEGIDTEGIAKAVGEILTASPHLKVEEEEQQPPPNRRQVGIGVKGGGSGDADVKPGVGRMSLAYSNGQED